MGKQKSFIIVGSTFIGIILLIILVSLITKGIKETKCNFEAELYPIEVGKSKALAPTLYAGGVVEDVAFDYIVENPGVIEVLEGTYSSGAASVYCWVFLETDKNGNSVEKESFVPHNEEDEITIVDGYWYINGEKTICKAESDYVGEDLYSYATRSVEPRSVNCYILNGIQTDIPYDKTIIPVRNEATGTWFIKGEDTGYTYKGIQVTIIAKSVGTTKITATGVIDGQQVTASTTIQVCVPNPNSIVSKYIDDTVIVKVNEEFKLDQYEVKAKSGSIAAPSQDVTYSVVTGKEELTVDNDVFKATAAGEYRVRIAVPRSSFVEGLGKYESMNVTVKVIVLDTTEEQITLIEAARIAIQNIGTVSNTDESKALVAAARLAVSLVDESNLTGVSNLKVLEDAEEKLSK